MLVSGVGTGGTLTGVSRYIKNTRGKPILAVAVEPVTSPVISQTLAGEEVKPARTRSRASAPASMPKNLDLSLVDQVEDQRRRSEEHGAAPDAGRRHPLRHLLRRGDGRRGAPGRGRTCRARPSW
ncbi:pyridoxal-phosphate dependent enzyme [Pseudomonas aeruginosa]